MAGLLNKYIITHTNGKPMNLNAQYFVLRLDNYCTDEHHLEACRAAAKVYAAYVEDVPHLRQIGVDLLESMK